MPLAQSGLTGKGRDVESGVSERDGYVKVWRKLIDSAIWKSRSTNAKLLFIHLLLSVNWKTGKWYVNHAEVEIQPGRRITSLSTLSEEAGMSIKEIRHALDVLEELSIIHRNRAHGRAQHWTDITILNWSTYQFRDDKEGTTSGIYGATEGQLEGIYGATIEEGKKERIPKPTRKLVQKTLAAWPRKPHNGNGQPTLDLLPPLATGSDLCDRYQELVNLWPERNRVGTDFGCQIWISYVGDGTITEQNIQEVFEGLDRWKRSESWTKENGRYIHSIANPNGSGGWLKQKLWKDYPPPAAGSVQVTRKPGVMYNEDGYPMKVF